MKKTSKSKKAQKLQKIEDNAFDMGTIAYDAFKASTNFAALRASVISYRASMQAMRDQMRYTISK
jgi:hypothetical protein